jgi:predicted XRE-type DNA-binding protein
MSSKQQSISVCDAKDMPEEAENMKLRANMMQALQEHIIRSGMNQLESAKLFGVTKPRISSLMQGKINLFSLDVLVNLADKAGLHVEMWVIEIV